jgi:hypothetical protein
VGLSLASAKGGVGVAQLRATLRQLVGPPACGRGPDRRRAAQGQRPWAHLFLLGRLPELLFCAALPALGLRPAAGGGGQRGETRRLCTRGAGGPAAGTLACGGASASARKAWGAPPTHRCCLGRPSPVSIRTALSSPACQGKPAPAAEPARACAGRAGHAVHRLGLACLGLPRAGGAHLSPPLRQGRPPCRRPPPARPRPWRPRRAPQRAILLPQPCPLGARRSRACPSSLRAPQIGPAPGASLIRRRPPSTAHVRGPAGRAALTRLPHRAAGCLASPPRALPPPAAASVASAPKQLRGKWAVDARTEMRREAIAIAIG